MQEGSEWAIRKKHMKKCSPSLAIKEMQIKTTLRFHLTTVRIPSLEIPPTTGVGKVVGEKGTLIHCWYLLQHYSQ
jgi:hypothetical protein